MWRYVFNDVGDYFEIAQQRKKLHIDHMAKSFHWWKMGSGG